jgi:hypothetical protein
MSIGQRAVQRLHADCRASHRSAASISVVNSARTRRTERTSSPRFYPPRPVGASGVSRASQTAKRGFRQSRPDAICRASSSVSAAAPSPVA